MAGPDPRSSPDSRRHHTHCSGAGIVVLEISATPYIYNTFKLWDWGSFGARRQSPRPIHIESRPRQQIAWERDNKKPNGRGANWSTLVGSRCRRQRLARGAYGPACAAVHRKPAATGFDAAVAHDTGSTVNVLNLVSGEACLIESPDDKYPAFTSCTMPKRSSCRLPSEPTRSRPWAGGRT